MNFAVSGIICSVPCSDNFCLHKYRSYDITITVTVIVIFFMEIGVFMRDDVKGGALTEVTFLILLALYQPRHGYAVMQYIEEQTGGRLLLGAGTLYGALNALLKKGWIEPFGAEKGRKKEYVITKDGKLAAENELLRLKQVMDIAENSMRGE